MTDRRTDVPIDLPVPGDRFHGRTVVASVWERDDADEPALALLILLNPRSPFYTVSQIIENEAHADGWNLVDPRDHFNINHATADFADSGGDV